MGCGHTHGDLQEPSFFLFQLLNFAKKIIQISLEGAKFHKNTFQGAKAHMVPPYGTFSQSSARVREGKTRR